MKPPVFPESFYKHCPKVQSAKDFHKKFQVGDEFVEQDWAECAFINAGCGKKCENCSKFLGRPFLGHAVDEEFLPLIEKFYDDLEAYEKSLETEKLDDQVPEHICYQVNLDGDDLVAFIKVFRNFIQTSSMYEKISFSLRMKIIQKLKDLEARYFELSGEFLA
jgi:hypothetical protein